MDFSLTEDQKMLKTMVQEFAQRELLPVAREDDRNGYYRPEIIKKMAGLGLVADMLPQEYGGSSLSNTSHAIIVEEIGRVNFAYVVSVFMVQLCLVELSLLRWGTKEQKDRYLSRLAAGELLGCFGAVEPNVGSDAGAVETTASLDKDGWVLNGTKTWITNASIADIAIILAKTEKSEGKGGITTFLIDTKTPGFSAREIKGKLGIRATNTAEVFLDNCRLPRENVLGEVGHGLKVALSAIDNARFTMAAGCVGIAQACIDASVKYAQARRQFNRYIGQFQLIQEMIADTIVETEAARHLVYRVGYLRDNGLPYSRETAIAKYYASKVAMQAADRAIQVHGGYSYSDEFPVERYYRDARVAPLFAGTNEIQKLIIAQHALGLNAVT
ncbi:MAG: acyl-CoA dehydrogenase family protein [Dehalococcoidia bacterium]|nr:acyl-CoA dehydrogenase family protein [Dehalococcoidia bacterium]